MTAARALLLLVSVICPVIGDASRLDAMHAPVTPPAVVVRGSGPTVVLLSGLLGGTARLEPLAERLIASGFRVVAIDPYRLAASEKDVSFDGLACSEARRRIALSAVGSSPPTISATSARDIVVCLEDHACVAATRRDLLYRERQCCDFLDGSAALT